MSPAGSNFSFAVRFRPLGPWRFGPDSGARDRVDLIYHSDAVFLGRLFCHAAARIWRKNGWQATARSDAAPAVRFSSVLSIPGRQLF